MFRTAPQGLGYFDEAPFRIEDSAHVAASPARVFDAFADAQSWPRWFPLMHEARWLSMTHEGIGAEREVALRGLGCFRERFVAWEPGSRLAFTMFETTSPFASAIAERFCFAEDGGGTRIDWTFAATPTRLGSLSTPVLRPMMRSVFRRAGEGLGRYLEGGR